MNKTSLLELAKKLYIPRRNYMETKEELEEVIKDTILQGDYSWFGYPYLYGMPRGTSKAADY